MTSVETKNEESCPLQLSNDFIEIVSKNRTDAGDVTLEVRPKPALIDQTHQAAIEAVRKEVAIPGFRKGKAPLALVKQNFSKAVIGQWHDEIASKALLAAVKLVGWPIVKHRKVNSKLSSELFLDPELVITYEYETIVPIALPDPAALDVVDTPIREVTEEEIEKRLELLRFENAEWETITDRKPIIGDLIVIDIVGADEPYEMFLKDHSVLLGDDVPKRLLELFCAMDSGQTLEQVFGPQEMNYESESAEDEHEEQEKVEDQAIEEGQSGEGLDLDVKADEKKLKITLHQIRQPKLSPLDEAFAKKFQVDSIDSLRKTIGQAIMAERKEHHLILRRDKVRQRLLELSDTPLTHSQRARVLQHVDETGGKELDQVKRMQRLFAEQQQLRWQLLRQALLDRYEVELQVDSSQMFAIFLQEVRKVQERRSLYFSNESELTSEEGMKTICHLVVTNSLLDHLWSLSQVKI